jgi:1,4-dihydroxy-2-naphthoate octaprenyltransferase
LLAAASVLCGVWYTAGRWSLAYLGLGDVFVLIFFGPVAVAGTYWVQALSVPAPVIWAGLGTGLIATQILVVNNLRDLDEDRNVSKKTLAVRFGRTFVRLEYTLCSVGAAIVPLALYRWGYSGRLWAPSLVLLAGIPLLVSVWRLQDARLNQVLAATGKLLLFYSIVFSLVVL